MQYINTITITKLLLNFCMNCKSSESVKFLKKLHVQLSLFMNKHISQVLLWFLYNHVLFCLFEDTVFSYTNVVKRLFYIMQFYWYIYILYTKIILICYNLNTLIDVFSLQRCFKAIEMIPTMLQLI